MKNKSLSSEFREAALQLGDILEDAEMDEKSIHSYLIFTISEGKTKEDVTIGFAVYTENLTELEDFLTDSLDDHLEVECKNARLKQLNQEQINKNNKLN